MKKKIIGSVIAAILVLAIVFVGIWQKGKTEENSEAEIKAGAGETIVYATIEQITGNDIDVALLEEEAAQQLIEISEAAKEAAAMTENNSSERTQSSDNMSGGGMPNMPGGGMQGQGSGGGMPNMMGGGMPGGSSGGGMPDMSDIESSEVVVMEVPESELNDMLESGEAPSGDGMPEGGAPDMESGERPQGGLRPGAGGKQKEQEKASYRIPVGTDVITTLGATTTFSHLEEGDTIAILMEQDSEAILKIWMIM